jgi:hypothetical protein
VAKYAAINQWLVSQMAYLMALLDAIKTPSGTLLDETTIYLFNRHGDGNGHTNYALPAIIGGGTGSYFKMGQFLQIPSPGVSPTKGADFDRERDGNPADHVRYGAVSGHGRHERDRGVAHPRRPEIAAMSGKAVWKGPRRAGAAPLGERRS